MVNTVHVFVVPFSIQIDGLIAIPRRRKISQQQLPGDYDLPENSAQ